MAKEIHGARLQSDEPLHSDSLVGALLDGLNERLQKADEENHAKLLLLCKRYGIQSGRLMFYDLALALAWELYPKPKKRGRGSKWNISKHLELVEDIERLIKPDDTVHGVKWASKELAKREKWKSFLEVEVGDKTSPEETLRRTYYEAKKAMDEWDRRIIDSVKNYHAK